MLLQLVKAHRALVRAHVPIPAPMLRADGTAIADADADAQSVRLHALKHAVANRHVEFSSGVPRSAMLSKHTHYTQRQLWDRPHPLTAIILTIIPGGTRCIG